MATVRAAFRKSGDDAVPLDDKTVEDRYTLVEAWLQAFATSNPSYMFSVTRSKFVYEDELEPGVAIVVTSRPGVAGAMSTMEGVVRKGMRKFKEDLGFAWVDCVFPDHAFAIVGEAA